MGRNAKPIDLLLLEGNSHLTKEQVTRRRASEIRLTNCRIRADELVMTDARALREFQFLRKLYKDIPFMGTLDSHIINQYCLAVSELDDLAAALARARVGLRDGGDPKLTLLLDGEIRLKRSELMKLSDRLYLNPVARTKNLPKQAEKPAEDANGSLFGDTG